MIEGKTARHVWMEGWEFPTVEGALETSGLFTIHEYDRRRQTNIEDCISTIIIYELCNGKD